jgi:hypothetical protein
MEAYYHLIFLGIAYVVFHRRYTQLVALLALLSWSHPFTGIQALAVVLLYYAGRRDTDRRVVECHRAA